MTPAASLPRTGSTGGYRGNLAIRDALDARALGLLGEVLAIPAAQRADRSRSLVEKASAILEAADPLTLLHGRMP